MLTKVAQQFKASLQLITNYMNSKPEYKGIICLILGEFFLAAMAAVIKYGSEHIQNTSLVFYRNLFGLLVLLVIFLIQKKPITFKLFRTKKLHWHLLRACSGITAMFGFFFLLGKIALAEAIVVKMSAPFILPIIAWFWLKESISKYNVLAIFIGFLGVWFMLQPSADGFLWMLTIGLGSAALASLAKVTIRKMGETESSQTIVLYFATFATLFSSIPFLISQQYFLNAGQCLTMLGIGLLGTSGQLLMTQAYRISKPGIIGVYTYSAIIHAALLGYIFWNEIPQWYTWAGAIFVIAAGIINIKAKKI